MRFYGIILYKDNQSTSNPILPQMIFYAQILIELLESNHEAMCHEAISNLYD